MRISYNKLQKLMIDNQMKRQDLMRAAEITSYAATKINKNEPVSLEVLMRICKVFHCDIGDICEVILDVAQALRSCRRRTHQKGFSANQNRCGYLACRSAGVGTSQNGRRRQPVV